MPFNNMKYMCGIPDINQDSRAPNSYLSNESPNIRYSDEHIPPDEEYTLMGQKPMLLVFLLLSAVSLGYAVFVQGGQFQDRLAYPVHYESLSSSPVSLILTGDPMAVMNTSILDLQEEIAEIAAIPDSDRTFENTILRFDRAMNRFEDQTALLGFLRDIDPDHPLSDKITRSLLIRDQFLNELYLNRDIAHILSLPVPPGAPEFRLKNTIRDDFAYALLDTGKKDMITRLGTELAGYEAQYQSRGSSGHAGSTSALVNTIADLRNQVVALLGYSSFAEYQVRESGIQTDLPGLKQILDSISAPLKEASHREAAHLLAVKQQSHPGATVVADYEVASLRTGSGSSGRDSGYSLRERYLPASSVIPAVHRIVSDVFNIAITEVTSISPGDPGLSLYQISDPRDGSRKAYFYLLTRPSENQTRTSGMTYYLRAGRCTGTCHLPAVSAVIVTVPSHMPDGEVLIGPESLETLFHEYGHMLRHSLSTSPYGRLSSMSREPVGYNEVISKFLERFASSPDVIERIYGPGADTGSVYFPDNPDQGTVDPLLYDLLLSDLDLTLHEGKEVSDFSTLFNERYGNYTGFQSTGGGAELLISPSFFVSGNAGVYWHYVIDDLLAAELFSRFSAGGVLNQSMGQAFRTEVLEPAGSDDPLLLYGRFLGLDNLSLPAFSPEHREYPGRNDLVKEEMN